eukprot:jgi/Hompol1/4520/HPOL_003691-RA
MQTHALKHAIVLNILKLIELVELTVLECFAMHTLVHGGLNQLIASSETLQKQAPLPEDAQVEPTASASTDGWSWGALWSTAASATATVTAVTARGLETAKAVAEQTAQAVSSNDRVKELYAGVAPEFSRLGSDLTTLAKRSVHTIAETIAPPINPDAFGSSGASPASGFASTQPFASKITVWLCTDLPDAEMLDKLHDFVQATVNEMWLRPFRPDGISKALVPVMQVPYVTDKAIVNSVQDPEPIVAKNLTEAMDHCKAITLRLQKLADARPKPVVIESADSPAASNPSASKSLDCFFIVQPFTTELPPSEIIEISSSPTSHRQYLCMLRCAKCEMGQVGKHHASKSH